MLTEVHCDSLNAKVEVSYVVSCNINLRNICVLNTRFINASRLSKSPFWLDFATPKSRLVRKFSSRIHETIRNGDS